MKLLALLVVCAVAHAKHEKYVGWKSYFIGLSTKNHFEVLRSMESKYELDILSAPQINRDGTVLVKPEHQEDFLQHLDAVGITHRIHVNDVKSELDYEDELIESHRRNTTARSGRSLPYDSFQQMEGVEAYIDFIGRQYPEVATVVHPANSFEGRNIKYLKISTTNFEDESKPIIFIDGGIHSREWITVPVVTYIIKMLVEDVTHKDLLDNFDWIILPVVNPDGYEFSHTDDRFWRKTRSTDQHAGSDECPGVDGNRNFDVFWGTTGVEFDPCSEIYPGSAAFSEIETRVVRDILHENLNRMAMYLNFHSYGSMFLYPWGYDGSLSQNAFGLHTVAVAMVEKIHENALFWFPRYIVGISALVMYPASGSSKDYAHYIGVPLSYTIELPGPIRGFVISPLLIGQVCTETWEGVVVGVRRAGELFKK